ncbi:hypothetical protein O3G_MSEX002433 [Manduca sexta]|uniref:Uncharacterized protein n=1 Tax=Manduca sexta TaxID=7130 RepID=A0A921YNK7_MANSE|nr:hypothetical protein O3G_MSEX002433 [Manduca sexta]
MDYCDYKRFTVSNGVTASTATLCREAGTDYRAISPNYAELSRPPSISQATYRRIKFSYSLRLTSALRDRRN